jgi:hypothetical protein
MVHNYHTEFCRCCWRPRQRPIKQMISMEDKFAINIPRCCWRPRHQDCTGAFANKGFTSLKSYNMLPAEISLKQIGVIKWAEAINTRDYHYFHF